VYSKRILPFTIFFVPGEQMSKAERILLAEQVGKTFASQLVPGTKGLKTAQFTLEDTVQQIEAEEQAWEDRDEKRAKAFLEKHRDKLMPNSLWGPPIEEQEQRLLSRLGPDPDKDEPDFSEDEDAWYDDRLPVDAKDDDQDDPYWMLNTVSRFTDLCQPTILCIKPHGSSKPKRVTWRCVQKSDRKTVVLSVAKDLGPAYRRNHWPREVELYAKLAGASNYICPLLRWCWVNENTYAIVTPYIPHVSPLQIDPADHGALARMIYCVAKALYTMKQNDVVHRDVAPENIWYDPKTRQAVLGDLDQAAPYRAEGFVPTTGRPAFRAPEKQEIISLRKKRFAAGKNPKSFGKSYKTKSDVYSLGVVALMVRKGMMKAPTQEQVRRYRVCDPSKEPVDNLIKQMVHEKPLHRIRLSKIFDHPFFGNLVPSDLDNLAYMRLTQTLDAEKKRLESVASVLRQDATGAMDDLTDVFQEDDDDDLDSDNLDDLDDDDLDDDHLDDDDLGELEDDEDVFGMGDDDVYGDLETGNLEPDDNLPSTPRRDNVAKSMETFLHVPEDEDQDEEVDAAVTSGLL
jgi:serine/threonine protein kinase